MENSSPNPSFSICDIRIQKRLAECFAKSFPQKIVLAKPSPHFVPPHCPNTWRAEPRKKNTLSFFKRNFIPAKSRKQGVFFLSGFPPSPRGGGGAILGAYDLCQSHHALRACLIRGSAGNKSELFGIMTTKAGCLYRPSVLWKAERCFISRWNREPRSRKLRG